MPRRRKRWTPEQRAAASLEARLRYEQTPAEVREAWLAKSRAVTAARYPHRARLYAELQAKLHSGEIVEQPCDRCGGAARMRLAFDDEAQTVELLGWRCYPCRKVEAG